MTVLKGYRVVELARDRLAFAGKLMADMGADVIVIEPPEGDPSRNYPPYLDDDPGPERSLYWWHYNTSKRGMTLDLDSPGDRELFRKLMARTDILIESEPRLRLRDLGLDYEQLLSNKADLIHLAMTPFGREDPRSDLPLTDLTLMAGSGPPWSCGYDDHNLPPVRGGFNQGYHTACHFVMISALTAILHREMFGEGQFIDVSMHAANNITTESATYGWLVSESTVQRQTGRHALPEPSMATQILCADGRYANTGVPPRFPEEFGKLLAWLKELGLHEDFPETVFIEMGAAWDGPFDLSLIGQDDTITAIFGSGREALLLIASRVSAQEFFTGCQSTGLSVGVVNTPEQAFEDPHFIARGFQTPVIHEDLDQPVLYPGAPYRLSRNPWAIRSRAPHLGEHNDEIRNELDS